jgi:hypothetical protein
MDSVRQIDTHTAESFEPETTTYEADVAIGKLKGIDCKGRIIFRQN